MSLRHAILALLTAEPMTGYDMANHFDDAVAFLWSAPHSQIYPELRKMEAEGLITAEEVPRGKRAIKRLYSLTDEGRSELTAWLEEDEPYAPERDVHRLKSAYFELTELENARRHLEAHLAHYRRRLDRWQEVLDSIHERRHPLLRLRLSQWPEEDHDAIVSYKALAFEGEVARARMEIDWAKRGLDVVERLTASSASVSR